MTTNTNAALVEYANPLNWDVDENGIRRVWKEPGSETPEAYNGFELAKAALSTAAQPTGEPVAYLWQHSETGRTRVVMPDGVITADATWHVVGPLVLAAAPKAAPAAQGGEEDSARLDWLESLSQVNLERVRYLGTDKSIYEVTPFGDDSYDGDTLRAAIDAARAQAQKDSND